MPFPRPRPPTRTVCASGSTADAQSVAAALSLYVQTAKATEQVAQARTVLETALADPAPHPEILMSVFEGFRVLGEKPDLARQALEKAADCTSATLSGRLAVARAKTLTGRLSEAEQLLTQEAARNPGSARVAYEFGRFLTLARRPLQAIEQFRTAVRLDDRNLVYREALATALHESGLDDDCLAECQSILDRNPRNATAAWLVSFIRLARGQELPSQTGPEPLAGGSVARAFLAGGRPQACVDACLEQLKKTPADTDTRSLLGRAYLVLGQTDPCIEQWTMVVTQAPDRLPAYLQLADVLGRTRQPEAVEAVLAAVPGANLDMVNLAIGWLLDRRGQHAGAAEAYGRVAGRPAATEDARNLARLFRAQSLAQAGHADLAIVELDQVTGSVAGRIQAQYFKAVLLASAGRDVEADALLTDMAEQAAKNRDVSTLERIAALYSRQNQPDKALAVCDRLDLILPTDARPCLVRAEVLATAGRLNDSVAAYQQAIQRQPGNPRPYLAVAQMLDAASKPLEALAALKQLEGLDQTGRLDALLERGVLLNRWGLYEQAAQCFEQVAALRRDSDPRLQLALGQAFAALGRKDQARQALGVIPEYAPPFVAAQQILASLEETHEAQLAVLARALKAKPEAAPLVAQQINILVLANRAAEAVKTFQAFASAHPVSDEVRNAGMRALLVTEDLAGAADLAARAAHDTGDPRWRQIAILLFLSQKSDAAKALLPPIDTAGHYETLLGLLAAAQTGQPTEPWTKRLDQVQQVLSQRTPPQSAKSMLLVYFVRRIVGGRVAAAVALRTVHALHRDRRCDPGRAGDRGRHVRSRQHDVAAWGHRPRRGVPVPGGGDDEPLHHPSAGGSSGMAVAAGVPRQRSARPRQQPPQSGAHRGDRLRAHDRPRSRRVRGRLRSGAQDLVHRQLRQGRARRLHRAGQELPAAPV